MAVPDISGHRRAFCEPEFGTTALRAPESPSTVVGNDLDFDIPAPETDVSETSHQADEAIQLSPAVAIHPVLAALEPLRERGQTWQALEAYRRLMQSVEGLQDPSIEEEAIWTGAARRTIEIQAGANAVDKAVDQIRQAAAWFQRPHWHRWREHAAAQFKRLILLATKLNQHQDALDLFEKARQLAILDHECRLALAQAAMGLERTDAGAADLYLDFLEAGDGSPDQRRGMFALLRKAIRIDLEHPDDAQLATHLTWNDRLWSFRAVAWCVAHRAIGAMRIGRIEDAWTLRQAAADLDQADAETHTLLAVVAYCNRRWSDALVLLNRAAELSAASPGIERLYLPMTRVNLALSGQTVGEGKERFLSELQEQATAMEACRRRSRAALDADWVLGTTWFLLGRDRESLAAFRAAPPQFLAWRYAVAYFEAAVRLGCGGQAATQFEQIRAESPQTTMFVRLLTSKDALRQLHLEEAAALVAAVTSADLETTVDTDLRGVHECLKVELALHEVKSLPEPPALTIPEDQLSAGVRSWFDRLRCRWHLERGEFSEAGRLLEQPLQWFASPADVQRLQAACVALQGIDEHVAENAFGHLADLPAAPPLDRLAWGLWLCARNDWSSAREVLAPLAGVLPSPCLEWQLALAEVELAPGGDTDRARALLQPLEEPLPWTLAPRLLPFRPWQRRLPIDVWGRSTGMSMHRIMDMLHGASLMIRAGRIEQALAVLGMADEHLGEMRALIHPQLGRIYRQACVAETEAGNLERACCLHRDASRYDGGDQEFAVLIAEATAGYEATPPDEILGVLCDWVCGFAGDERSLEQTSVAGALRTFLLIDQVAPEDPSEHERRRSCTESLHEARPAWDWPKQNLAREAARAGNHERVVALVDSIAAPNGDDLFLHGLACWQLERFEEAFASFSRSIAVGNDIPEVRAWRGCASAALRFRRWTADGDQPSPEELDQMLPHLVWAGCGAACQVQVRAWHGAVLVAAGRGEKAIDVLDLAECDEALRSPACVLRGLAMLQAGRRADAAALWDGGNDLLATSPLEQSLRLLVLEHDPDPQVRQTIGGQLHRLRQRGFDNEAYHLAAAHWSLRDGGRESAEESLHQADAAAKTAALDGLLAPLRRMLHDERRWIEAQFMSEVGKPAVAAAWFEELREASLWPEDLDLRHAECLLCAGEVDRAGAQLADLLKRHPDQLDAESLLALVCARQGALAEAELARQRILAEAELHTDRVLGRQPSHLLALRARAEVQESRGDRDGAIRTYRAAVDAHAESAGKRALAGVLLALGRLEHNAGWIAEAEADYRRALALRPAWMLPRRRLALLLVIHGQDPQRAKEARELLAQLAAEQPEDAVLGVSEATVAHRQERWEDAAVALDRVIRLSSFRRLPAPAQRAVALWSVDAQLIVGRFGEAADALRELAGAEAPPEIEDRMIQCWLLQGIQLLQKVPLADAALDQALADANAVLARRPEDPRAVLLAALCSVLGKRAAPEQQNQLAARLQKLEFSDPRERAVAAVTRLLAGDDGGKAELETLLESSGDGTGPRRNIELLLANRNKDVPRLAKEARQIAADPENVQESPLDHDELLLIGALDSASRRREEEAIRLLETWHRDGRGSDNTRTLHSQLLARQVVKTLRGRQLAEARELLLSALKVLQQGVP